jgi:anti-sigma regulatory factor (Ser/Thr protein kinase)
MKLGSTKQSQNIRAFLIDGVRSGRRHLVEDASEMFGVKRQTVLRHLANLTERGFLEATGSGQRRRWRLGPIRSQVMTYALDAITEDRVYTQDFAFIVDGLAQNIQEIWQYGFTEMLNNAIDHSGGTEVEVFATRGQDWLMLRITDDGEGIFERITRLLQLSDPREALLELSKGKLTTDPENHTGEGIFFTSRAFDVFEIRSGDLRFLHVDEALRDLLKHGINGRYGTVVLMLLSVSSTRTLKDVFDAYTDAETLDFSKTIVPVRLALYEGEQLVSRSQAKRIMNRVERFRHVVLDFQDVQSVGRSFVDEIFRVFVGKHPEIDIAAVNMLPAVAAEVQRVKPKA